MQSVLSLPLRLSDTLLSPFKESNNVFISPYWEKIAIIFFQISLPLHHLSSY